jgi:hypothetical protein
MMTKLRTIAIASIIVAFAGCATAHPPPRIAPGQPYFGPGAPEAYWLWHDEGGWHLRTTTAGRPHRFHGTVTPLGGQIIDLRPSHPRERERISMSPNGISFDLLTQGGENGFDWHVSSGCNRFEIFVDGAPRPGLVHLGGASEHPRHIPFDRCR